MPGIKLFDSFRLVTAKDDIERFIVPYSIEIGTLDVGHFLQPGVCMIYEHNQVEIDRHDQFFEHCNGLVIAKLAKIQNWISNLWVVRDHAINHNIGFLAIHYKDEYQTTSNMWMVTFSKADGSSSDVVFVKEEISGISKILPTSEYGETAGAVALVSPGYHGGKDTKLDDDGARVQRFFYFTSGARASRDIAIKVSLYSSALEALVSSAHSELTHQVAERVAFTISDNLDERLRCYKSVKLAYGMRSRAVHGATFRPNEIAKLTQSVIEIDEVCRKLAQRIYADPDFLARLKTTGEDFEESWRKVIFSP